MQKLHVFSREIEYKKVYPPQIRSDFANTVVELMNIGMKSVGIEVVAKNHLQPHKTMFLPQLVLKIMI